MTYTGKGIVMCAGGVRYFTCAWVAITNLRLLGCKLPIEVWYLGDELSLEIIVVLNQMDVTCHNFFDYGMTSLSGVALKPLAILKSRFKEILFIDADNNCVRDPTYLFRSLEYIKYGAIFWPDYWRTAKDNPIWDITNNYDYEIPEQESGQILIDKSRCWKELSLCVFFNEKSKIYHRILYGDKDTFKFAWHALKTKFHMVKMAAGACGYFNIENRFLGNTIVQHDIYGQILFLHRNLNKWDGAELNKRTWQTIRRFKPNAEKKEYILRSNERRQIYIDLQGDVEDWAFTSIFHDYETTCLTILTNLRESEFYNRFLSFCNSHTYKPL